MQNLPPDVINSLKKQAPKELKRDFNKVFKKNFDRTKKEMIKEFLSHPVTIELYSGAGGTNISGTLGGISNLFAFIGFPAGEDPIKPIIELLEKTSYRDGGNAEIGRTFVVDMPSSEDIFAVTPMPWATGRSWARGIEIGISGLGHLLRKETPKSRSSVAIQVKNKVRGGKFYNTSYISALLKKYEKQFKNIK